MAPKGVFLLLTLLVCAHVCIADSTSSSRNVYWQVNQNPLSLARAYAGSTFLNDKLYVFGGDEGSGVSLSNGEVFDPVTGEWDTTASMDSANAVRFTSAAQYENRIYVFGGEDRNGLAVDHVRRFTEDPSNPWTIMGDMIGGARSHVPTALVVDGLVYLVNGKQNSTSSTPLNDTVVFDPATETWSTLGAPDPNYPRFGHGIANLGRKIYIVGGQLDGGMAARTGSMEVLDLDNVTAGWTELASMGTKRYYATVLGYGGRIWAIGGFDENGNILNTTEYYDPYLDKWYTGAEWPDLTRTRGGAPWGINDGRLYIASGFSDFGNFEIVVATTEFIDLASPATCVNLNSTEVTSPINLDMNSYAYLTNGMSASINFTLTNTTGRRGLLTKKSCTANEGGFTLDIVDGYFRMYSASDETVYYEFSGLPQILEGNATLAHIELEIVNPLSDFVNLMTIMIGGQAQSISVDLTQSTQIHPLYLAGGCYDTFNGTIHTASFDCLETSYPYTQTFDALDDCPTLCSVNDYCALPTNWASSPITYNSLVPPVLTVAPWKVGNETPSAYTGPQNGDHSYTTGAGKFLFVETSAPCSGQTYYAVDSPYFKFGDPSLRFLQGDITMSFWYHMYGTNVDFLHVDAEINGLWMEDIITPIESNYNQWRQSIVVLNSYLANNVTLIKFRFRYNSLGDGGDVAIDDFMVQLPTFVFGSEYIHTLENNTITFSLDGVDDLSALDVLTLRDGSCVTRCGCDEIWTVDGLAATGTGRSRIVEFTPSRFYELIHVCLDRTDGTGIKYLGQAAMTSMFSYVEEPTVGRTTQFRIEYQHNPGDYVRPFQSYEEMQLRTGPYCNTSSSINASFTTVCVTDYCIFTITPFEAIVEGLMCIDVLGTSQSYYSIGPTFRVNNPFTYETTILQSGVGQNIIRVWQPTDLLNDGRDVFTVSSGGICNGNDIVPNPVDTIIDTKYQTGNNQYRDIYFTVINETQISLCRTLKGITARLGDAYQVYDVNTPIHPGSFYLYDFELMNLFGCSACDSDNVCLCPNCPYFPSSLSYGININRYYFNTENPTLAPNAGQNTYMHVVTSCLSDASLTTGAFSFDKNAHYRDHALYATYKYYLSGDGQPIIFVDARNDTSDEWVNVVPAFIENEAAWKTGVIWFSPDVWTEDLQLRFRYELGTTANSDFRIDDIRMGRSEYWTSDKPYLGIRFWLEVPHAENHIVDFRINNCSGAVAKTRVEYTSSYPTYTAMNLTFYEQPSDLIYICTTDPTTNVSTALQPPIEPTVPATFHQAALTESWFEVTVQGMEAIEDDDVIDLRVGSCVDGGCVSVAENELLVMDCDDGIITSISFASYGVSTGCFDPLPPCHDPDTLTKVQNNFGCIGSSWCNISASNDYFFDDCVGQSKNLRVLYACDGALPLINAGQVTTRERNTTISNGTLTLNISTSNQSYDNVYLCYTLAGKSLAASLSAPFQLFSALENDIGYVAESFTTSFTNGLNSINVWSEYGIPSGATYSVRQGEDCTAPFLPVVRGVPRSSTTMLAFDLISVDFVPSMAVNNTVVCQHYRGMTTRWTLPNTVYDASADFTSQPPGPIYDNTQPYEISSYAEGFDLWPRQLDDCNPGCTFNCQYYPAGFSTSNPAWQLRRPAVYGSDDYGSSVEGCFYKTPNGCPSSPTLAKSRWTRDTVYETANNALAQETQCTVTVKNLYQAACGVAVETKWVAPGGALYFNNVTGCSAGISAQVQTPLLRMQTSALGARPWLTFRFWMEGEYGSVMHIDGRTDASSAFVSDIMPPFSTISDGWQIYSTELPTSITTSTTSDFQLQFRFAPFGSSAAAMSLDDVTLMIPSFKIEDPAMGLPTSIRLYGTITQSLLIREGDCYGTIVGTFIYQDWNAGIRDYQVVFADLHDDIVLCLYTSGNVAQFEPHLTVDQLVTFDWEPQVGRATTIRITGRDTFDHQDSVAVRKDSCTGDDIMNVTAYTYYSADNTILYHQFEPTESYGTAVVCIKREGVPVTAGLVPTYHQLTRPFPIHVANGTSVTFDTVPELRLTNVHFQITVNISDFNPADPGTIALYSGECIASNTLLGNQAATTVVTNTSTGFEISALFTSPYPDVKICRTLNGVIGALGDMAIHEVTSATTGELVIDNLFTLTLTSTGAFSPQYVVWLNNDNCDAATSLAYGNPSEYGTTTSLERIYANSSWAGSVAICLGHNTTNATVQVGTLLHFAQYGFTYNVHYEWIELRNADDVYEIDLLIAPCINHHVDAHDDITCPRTLGAPFTFYDDALSTIYMSTNGLLSNQSKRLNSNVCPLQSNTGDSRLMVLHDDLRVTEALQRTYTTGCPHSYNYEDPCDVFTWYGVLRASDFSPAIGSTTTGAMQVILWPSTGRALMQYTGKPFTTTATIGVANADGTDGIAAVCNEVDPAMRRYGLVFCPGGCKEQATLLIGLMVTSTYDDNYVKWLLANYSGVDYANINITIPPFQGSPVLAMQYVGLYPLAQDEAIAALDAAFENGNLNTALAGGGVALSSGHLIVHNDASLPVTNFTLGERVQAGVLSNLTLQVETHPSHDGLVSGGNVVIGFPHSEIWELVPGLVQVDINGMNYSGDALSFKGQKLTVNTASNPMPAINFGATMTINIIGTRPTSCRFIDNWLFYVATSDNIDSSEIMEYGLYMPTSMPCYSECDACQYSHALDDGVSDVYLCTTIDPNTGSTLRWQRVNVRNPDGTTICDSCGSTRCDSQTALL